MNRLWFIGVLFTAWCSAAQAQAETAATPGIKFRDCSECPELIVIPAGSFMMGSPSSEVGSHDSERPQHRVSVQAFATGIYPVTRDEYATFVRETGRSSGDGCVVWNGKPVTEKGSFVKDSSKNWSDPGFQQTGRDPVVCVSWEDAQAYVRWLNDKVRSVQHAARSGDARPYRLLAEAEWEYAARGSTATPHYWGDHTSHDNANYGVDKCPPCGPLVQGNDQWNYTSPVGSFAPNAFGLYDMSGNVFQWLQDCWHDNYKGAPSDGTPWTTGNCKYRVDRGGDWFDDPLILRVAYREMDSPDGRDYFSGFRVARTLD